MIAIWKFLVWPIMIELGMLLYIKQKLNSINNFRFYPHCRSQMDYSNIKLKPKLKWFDRKKAFLTFKYWFLCFRSGYPIIYHVPTKSGRFQRWGFEIGSGPFKQRSAIVTRRSGGCVPYMAGAQITLNSPLQLPFFLLRRIATSFYTLFLWFVLYFDCLYWYDICLYECNLSQVSCIRVQLSLPLNKLLT